MTSWDPITSTSAKQTYSLASVQGSSSSAGGTPDRSTNLRGTQETSEKRDLSDQEVALYVGSPSKLLSASLSYINLPLLSLLDLNDLDGDGERVGGEAFKQSIEQDGQKRTQQHQTQ